MSGSDIAAIFQGAVVTVTLSLIGILIGLPIGLGLALIRWANLPIGAGIVTLYVSMLRATPLVTLLLLLFFVLPNIGVPIDPISAAILALVMNTSAFNCEVWRSALMNFPKDQYEAAQSVGMRAGQRFRRIVLPQIVRVSLPGLVNEMSLLIKVTPVLAVVGVVDITRAAVRIGAQTYEPLPPLLVAAALDRTAPDRGRGRRMIHDFGIVWNERALLLSGLANTAILSTLAAIAALLLGFTLTPALMSKRLAVSRAARIFVDGMRCVPFLLFAYIVYYGLPSFGVRLDNWTSGLAALTVYNAAYMAEILRGAWVVQPREPIEAGIAFGFPEIRLFRRIILPPLLLSAGPVIGNQMIQIIKDSAFLTIIALPELTHAASSIQSRHYVPFAAFITAVFLYWGLCLIIEAGVGSIGRLAEARR